MLKGYLEGISQVSGPSFKAQTLSSRGGWRAGGVPGEIKDQSGIGGVLYQGYPYRVGPYVEIVHDGSQECCEDLPVRLGYARTVVNEECNVQSCVTVIR